jgi:phosphoribosyl-ATP pyrophosphohydrolase
MNVTDVQAANVVGDKLQAIFDRQMELLLKYREIEGMPYGVPPLPLDTALGQKWVRDFMWRVTEELAEAYECRNAQDHFVEEISDAIHFLVELFILSGIDRKDIPGTLEDQFRSVSVASGVGHYREKVWEFIYQLGISANVLRNKAWKQTQVPTDLPYFRKLLLESWMKFIHCCSHTGMDAESFTEIYFKKSEVNKFRIRSYY